MDLKAMKIALAVLGALVAVGLAGNTWEAIETKRTEATAQAAQAERLRIAQEKRDALAAELQANKVVLLSDAQRSVDHGDSASALASLTKFEVLRDPDVTRLRESASKKVTADARIKTLQGELALKPQLERSMAIYTEMATLEPTNAIWPALIQEAHPSFAALEAHNAQLKKIAARQKSVHLLFSAWDGSVRAVEEGIKARLKDPDSYKHVDTKFKDTGLGNVTVFTQYRARNSFNAVVPGKATAEVSPSGELVSIYLEK